MEVVDGDVADAAASERWHNGRFPNTFGEPRTARAHAECPLEPLGHRADLSTAVDFRKGREDRLGVPAAEDLELTAVDHRPKPLDVGGKFSREELEKPTAHVRGELELRMTLEHFKERTVAALARV